MSIDKGGTMTLKEITNEYVVVLNEYVVVLEATETFMRALQRLVPAMNEHLPSETIVALSKAINEFTDTLPCTE